MTDNEKLVDQYQKTSLGMLATSSSAAFFSCALLKKAKKFFKAILSNQEKPNAE